MVSYQLTLAPSPVPVALPPVSPMPSLDGREARGTSPTYDNRAAMDLLR
jgi:hypothetical protein